MKKFWKNPWTIGVGTALFSFFLTVLYDLVKGKQILSTFADIFIAIWHAVVAFLTFDLKVWWVLLGIAILFLILIFIIKLSEQKETIESKWLQYTNDIIDGYCWEWRWEKTYSGLYDISNLHPVCPDCKTPYVSADDFRGGIMCPRCKHHQSFNMYNTNNIEVIIKDNVKRMIEQEYNSNESIGKSGDNQ